MSDEEIAEKLEQFSDFLDIGNIFMDPFRLLGWVIIKGLMLILDGLEKVTNDVLFLKKFFNNTEITSFVDSIQPFLYILLAFSILYAGYMLIFQKKFNREGMVVNIFISLSIIALLSTGMEKANEFTDEAIDFIGSQQLYSEEKGTLSENIISRNITDLTEFDQDDWSTTKLDKPNNIPLSMLGKLSITEKFDSSRKELDMSKDGKKISKKALIWSHGKKDLSKMDQSGLEWNNSYYYRYNLDWISLITTMIVMAFTLISISYKLARLSFELAFNYVLAYIVAPVDIHDGQKTKKILQSILNTFIVIILIFLSMKVYMIGTSWLADELSGLAYIIALIAFSVAVIDGPNIVERLFGIDAGLKSGWGVMAGAYTGGKAIAGTTKAVGRVGKSLAGKGKEGGGGEGGTGKGKNKPSQTEKPPSPNDEENSTGGGNSTVGEISTGGEKSSTTSKSTGEKSTGEGEKSTGEGEEGNGKKSEKGGNVSKLAEQKNEQKGNSKSSKAPSPNDHEGKQGTEGTDSQGKSSSETSSSGGNSGGSSPISKGSNSGTGGNKSTPKPTSAKQGNQQGSHEVNKSKSQQKSTVQTDTEVDNIVEEVGGNQSTNTKFVGGGSSSTEPKPTNTGGGDSHVQGKGTHETRTTKVEQRSTVDRNVKVDNKVQERKRPKQYNMGKNSNKKK